MTTFNSDSIYGQSIAFDPNVDKVNFDEGEKAPTSFVSQSGPDVLLESLTFSPTFGLKSFTLQNVDLRALDSSNFVFADGGQALIGDNTHGTANDDAANLLTSSGVGYSLLMGLGGADTLIGAASGDALYGGDGNDVLSGAG